MGELSEQNRTLVKRLKIEPRQVDTYMFCASALNRLLDAARTEGPGEESAETKLRDAYAALRSIAEGNLGDQPWQASYETIKQVARNALVGASPIREPEISRETWVDKAARIIDPKAFERQAQWVDGPNFNVTSAAIEENDLLVARAKSIADAILNLAPVGGRGEEAKPISPLRIIDDKPEWQQIIDLFERHGLDAPPVRLRDELVNHLAWAKFGAAQ